METVNPKSLKKTEMICVVAVAFLLLLSIFSRIVNFEIRKDEQLYAPPADLLKNFELYSDFFYNHVPTTAWYFFAVKTILSSEYLILSARIGVVFSWFVLAAAVVFITYALTRSVAMIVFSLAFFMANELFLGPAGMTATNNFIPLPFAYLGIGMFVLAIQSVRPSRAMVALSGLCLGLAATMKASAVAFIAPVAIAAFFLPANLTIWDRLKLVTVPLALGGLVGSIPVLVYLARDPELFIAHVVQFHTGPHVAYWAAQNGTAESVAMSHAAKARFGYLIWFSGTNLIFVLTAIFFLVRMIREFKPSQIFSKFFTGPIVLVVGTIFVTVVMSFIPTPSFAQYFAPPLVCLPVLLALFYARFSEPSKREINTVLIAASITMVLINLPRLGSDLPRLIAPETWLVTKAHTSSQSLASELSERGLAGKVATLAPIYPVEAKLPVYLEFATGPFAYRIAPFAESALLQHYRTTSPEGVIGLFESDPPAAILVGFEPDLEKPLIEYAESMGYEKLTGITINDRYGQGILYTKN